MSTPVVDFDSLSLDELMKRAEQEAAQPRDEKGRFTKSEPEPDPNAEPAEIPAQEPEPEEVDEVVYRREIDLGDGSGKQVFEAASPEELIEKLATAQEHATRKIRELSAAKKVEEAPKEEGLTEEERWLLSQEMMTEPDKAFDKLFKKKIGLTPQEFQERQKRLDEFERVQTGAAAEREFVESHPDYLANAANGRRMTAYLNTYKLDWSVENMDKAYRELAESGLLQVKPAENAAPADNGVEAEPERIARPVETTRVVRKAASGLSAKRNVPAVSSAPTEDDLYDMPLDQLEKLARTSSL